MIIITKRFLFIIAGIFIIVITSIFVLHFTQKRDTISENLNVTSPAFENNGIIPVKYTGKGEDISPPLEFNTIAPDAATIAIIMDDPDAPGGTFTHWLIWNIPAGYKNIPAAIPREKVVAMLGGASQGLNGFGDIGYRGPLPPSGTHTYHIKVYVLDTVLNLEPGAGKSELQDMMKGHILQYGLLKGKFSH